LFVNVGTEVKLSGLPPSLKLPSSLTTVAKAMAVKKLRRTSRRTCPVQD
jgi:hypothetical protein